ncbi:MAG TPA: type I methionyl aminopeptidase [bacterium]|nr:type I methionyl aminopeptidase [bacterium]
MSVTSPEELERLRIIGRIVRRALDAMAASVRPGATTGELNGIGARVLAEHGAEPSPPKVYGFPGAVCISVNDEAVHGIPGERVLHPGDLVKLDLVAEKGGVLADAAVTVGVGPLHGPAEAIVGCAERAFRQAARVARAGARISEIGRAVTLEATRGGFCVMPELGGHGVGRTIHEAPSVPNYPDPNNRARLTEGLVITIEPIIAAGTGRGLLDPNGWTVRTADGSLSAHYEHTLVITRDAPILLTA